MAHAVESMMYTGELPWHGLGTYLGDDTVTGEAAMTAAGLDWHVGLWAMRAAPPAAVEGTPCPLCAKGTVIRGKRMLGCDRFKAGCDFRAPFDAAAGAVDVPDAYAVVRNADKRVLGTVGPDYKPLQNTEAFGLLDSLAEAGEVRYHTAGSLKGGRRVWLLAEISSLRIEPVPGDVSTPYLLLSNGHDGRVSLRVLPTAVRVVCQNTATLALQQGKRDGITIRHTGDMAAKVAEARQALGFCADAVETYAEQAAELARTPMTLPAFLAFAETLVPDPEKGNPARARGAREKLVELFEAGPGTELRGVRGTRWAALNAVTDYSAHWRTTTGADDATKAANRLERIWFGNQDDLNATALRTLLAAA
jgi:phage/plasmid-like protein (TIGR03299 family)